MAHLRVVVIDLPDAVAAVVAHDAEAFLLGHLLDGGADVAQRGAGAHLQDAGAHRLVGGVHQALREHAGFADEVHAARVAVPAVLDHGHVDVDDVAVLELLVARNAVAHDVVHRGAHRLRVAVIADVGGNRLLHVDDVIVAQLVELVGGDAGLHVGRDHAQHVGRQRARDARHGDLGGRLDHVGALLHRAALRMALPAVTDAATATSGRTNDSSPAPVRALRSISWQMSP